MIKQRISALTSLRFFAAAIIVIDHATGYRHGWIRDIPYYQGVTFFFVLSGFILTYSYPALVERREVLNFWLARFARIWPAYFASTVLTICLMPAWLKIMATPYGVLRTVLTTTALQSWVPQSDYYFFLNAVCWSVSVEAFFYLLFPFLLANLEASWHWKLLLCLVPALLVVIAATASDLPVYARNSTEIDVGALIYIFPVTRLPEFMIGMVAAMVFLRRPSGVCPRIVTATLMEAVVATAVLAQFLVGPTWYEGGPLSRVFDAPVCIWFERSGSAPLYALLIFVMAGERGLLSRLLRFRPLVLGGEISFSMYLVHQPVMLWMHTHSDLLGSISPMQHRVLFVAVVLLTSYIFWVAIERPARWRIMRSFRFL